MANIIGAIVVIALVGGASFYIYKEKKKGSRCIGCSMSGRCPKHGACAADGQERS